MSCNLTKSTFGLVRPAKIQIRLRIRAVWSESSLDAFWIAKDEKFLHASNEDSDQMHGCAGWFESSLSAYVQRNVFVRSCSYLQVQTWDNTYCWPGGQETGHFFFKWYTGYVAWLIIEVRWPVHPHRMLFYYNNLIDTFSCSRLPKLLTDLTYCISTIRFPVKSTK